MQFLFLYFMTLWRLCFCKLLLFSCKLSYCHITPCPGKKRPQYSRHNFDRLI